MRFAAFLILLIIHLSLFAQTYTGKVKDKNGEPLPVPLLWCQLRENPPLPIVSQVIKENINWPYLRKRIPQV